MGRLRRSLPGLSSVEAASSSSPANAPSRGHSCPEVTSIRASARGSGPRARDRKELGTDAKIAGFVGVVEHGYVEDDITHHELNLVFEIAIADTEPASQEDHLEFHWLPLDQLADTDVRPGSLKNALVAAGDGRTRFWHGWNG